MTARLARGAPPWLALVWVAALLPRRAVVRVPVLALAVAGTWFFRDPDRRPDDHRAAFVCAADGRVTRVERHDDDRWLVSTYLDLLDVHVTRSPCPATVRVRHRVGGAHVPAFRPDAHANERLHWDLDSPHGPVVLTQLAGVLARRIVPYVGAGADLAAGERIGLIRFGSRVDVLLPPGALPAVVVGDRVRAGRTTLATA